jgi:hypothetical protein
MGKSLKIFSLTRRAKKAQIYWQVDLMAIKKSNVAFVHKRNISQYGSGERCGPWASCLNCDELFVIVTSYSVCDFYQET